MSRCDTAGRVLSLDGALEAIAAWRAAGEKVVCLRGVFDLLHAGHARALADARRGRSRLVVAVEDDASAAATLGHGRPVSPGSDRARVVAALRGVDAVVLADAARLDRLREAVGESRAIGGALDAERWDALRRAESG